MQQAQYSVSTVLLVVVILVNSSNGKLKLKLKLGLGIRIGGYTANCPVVDRSDEETVGCQTLIPSFRESGTNNLKYEPRCISFEVWNNQVSASY